MKTTSPKSRFAGSAKNPLSPESCKENKIDSVQIMYYPRCKDSTVKIIIYDNESAAFTDLMIKKINNADNWAGFYRKVTEK